MAIDAYRRQLQRNYLELVNSKINGGAVGLPAGLPSGLAAFFAFSGDEKGFYRTELRSLNAAVSTGLGKSSDRATRAHLEAVRDEISRILDPKFEEARGGGLGGLIIFGNQWATNPWSAIPSAIAPMNDEGAGQDGASGQEMQNCWPDYVIRP